MPDASRPSPPADAPEPVIKLGGVYARPADGLSYGPVNLALGKGQGALVTAEELMPLKKMMEICAGLCPPEEGEIRWWGGTGPYGVSLWGAYAFHRRVGLVHRQSQLISGITLLANLGLIHAYNKVDQLEATRLAREELDRWGLLAFEETWTQNLTEPQRRVALYALAFAKNPDILLVERPRQFLDRDFGPVWSNIQAVAEERGLAYMVFDRNASLYEKDDFKESIELWPGGV